MLAGFLHFFFFSWLWLKTNKYCFLGCLDMVFFSLDLAFGLRLLLLVFTP